MTDTFFKFPSTPHLATSPGVDVRGDKVFSPQEREAFLRHEVTLEEKMDGANLGISFDDTGTLMLQNRGGLLLPPFAGQWKKLPEWLALKMDPLFDHLTDRFILFGEWCYAKHSIPYTRLPDWFIGFDIFDKTSNRFFSCQRRNQVFHQLSITPVPQLGKGIYSLPELMKQLPLSHCCNLPAEGIVLRHDQDEWLVQRSKLVASHFSQTMSEQHWSHGSIKPNSLALA